MDPGQQQQEVPDSVGSPIAIEAFDAIVFTFFGLAALTTAARVYLWSAVLKSGILDNILIAAGTLMTLAITILTHYEVTEVHLLAETFNPAAFGPSGMLPTDFENHFNRMYRFGQLATLVYLITLPLIKCAILAFYRKIVISKKSIYFLYILAFIFMSQGIVNFIVTIVELERNGSIWNVIDGEFDDPGNALNQVVNSSFQICFDILLLAIPIPVIWSLKIRNSAKVGLFVVYAISFVSLAATIIRLVKVRQFYSATGSASSVLAAERSYWTLIEMDTAIFCANLPALSSLLRMLRGQMTGSSTTATTSGRSSRPTGARAFQKRFVSSFSYDKSKSSSHAKHNTKLSSLRSGMSYGNGRSGREAYENIDSFPLSHRSTDEHARDVKVYRGGKGEGGDITGSGWPQWEDKSEAIVTVDPPEDGIQKTYEFSAVMERGRI